ncbi:MAG: hypothetical protein D4R93_06925 [Deltaproteobacteria bacterium]|nr:MAG: hypothetical protein D4R93_06925 [Deltaproteobacteria bacterium]
MINIHVLESIPAPAADTTTVDHPAYQTCETQHGGSRCQSFDATHRRRRDNAGGDRVREPGKEGLQ